uniref:Uncharacterized protein n=1 Tax=Arundo donax TaxID=35708 RepID=A0A0A9GXJ8_ARUDO
MPFGLPLHSSYTMMNITRIVQKCYLSRCHDGIFNIRILCVTNRFFQCCLLDCSSFFSLFSSFKSMFFSSLESWRVSTTL